MTRCENPWCDGHLGKFPDCIAEALWDVSMADGMDEQTGNTDWEAWYALIALPEAERWPVNAYDPDSLRVDIPAATYILGEDSRGAVFYTGYTDSVVAQAAWDDINARFAEWDVDQ